MPRNSSMTPNLKQKCVSPGARRVSVLMGINAGLLMENKKCSIKSSHARNTNKKNVFHFSKTNIAAMDQDATSNTKKENYLKSIDHISISYFSNWKLSINKKFGI